MECLMNFAVDLPIAKCTWQCIYWHHFQGMIILYLILDACYQKSVSMLYIVQ